MIPQILIATSAAIALVLGFLHLAYTFFTRKLNPRDEELEGLMRQVSPRLTRETTMWKGWIAFNATHSLGIILFGTIYGYLSLFAWALLAHSAFFLGLGVGFFASATRKAVHVQVPAEIRSARRFTLLSRVCDGDPEIGEDMNVSQPLDRYSIPDSGCAWTCLRGLDTKVLQISGAVGQADVSAERD